MFNFLFDMDNHEERKVARYEEGDLIIDTCSVSDGNHPFETAVSHPDYNRGGEWMIVESYDTEWDAQVGHDNWVKKMTTEPLPDEIVDCTNAGIARFLLSLTDEETEKDLITYKRENKRIDL